MDPFSDFGIDLGSTSGQREHAKKKKKPAAAPVNSGGAGDGEEKKDDAPGDGNSAGGGGGSAGGDAGAGAGGSGDGNGDGGGDDKKDTNGEPDDEWATFGGAKPKKKGGKDLLGGLPAIPTSDFGTDSFQEIKLGDDSAGKIDLGFGASDPKNNLGSWGTKWNTGGNSNWDWSSGGAGKAGAEEPPPPADAGGVGEAIGDDNPWGINRPKPKKKTKANFSFGSFDEAPDPPAEDAAPKADDGWGFVSSKDKKKTSIWGAAEPEKKEEEKTGVGSDSWGWGSTKKKDESAPPGDDWFTPAKKDKDKDKDKKKKGSAMLLDNTIEEPSTDKKEDDLWGTWGAPSKKEKTSTLLDDFGTSSTLSTLNPLAAPVNLSWSLATGA